MAVVGRARVLGVKGVNVEFGQRCQHGQRVAMIRQVDVPVQTFNATDMGPPFVGVAACFCCDNLWGYTLVNQPTVALCPSCHRGAAY